MNTDMSEQLRAGEPRSRLNPLTEPAEPALEPPTRPLALGAIAISGVLACAVVGGSTNAVNGLVSPLYFVTVLRWQGVEDVWRAAIAQGIYEGMLFGLFFTLVFAMGVGILTGVACSYAFAFKHLVGVVVGGYVCWLLGGLAAVGLAALSPEFYRAAFFGVPDDFGAMLGYAFVGGSIWGAEFGGFVSVIIGLVILRANWRRAIRMEAARA